MKFAILFALVATAASSSVQWNKATGDIETIVRNNGYDIKKYEVETKDGYQLDLFRIRNEQQYKQGDKKPVLMIHGFLSNAEVFVYGGKTHALAYYLADQGYDVYLGNTRGTVYGQRHIHLNPDNDRAFWRFCFQEIGTKDLPAIIKKVLEQTQETKLNIVGHKEGTTAVYVMLSEMPEYNEKIERFVALGPMAYMGNSQEDFIQKAKDQNQAWITKNIGVTKFNPSNDIEQEIRTQCLNENDNKVCDNHYFLVNGYNSKNIKSEILTEVTRRMPDNGSLRQFLHLMQLKKNDRFQKFDEKAAFGKDRTADVPEYDLTKVTAPVAVIYTGQDKLAAVEDVQRLINQLPNVYAKQQVAECTNNLDLLWGKNQPEVNRMVMQQLQHNSRV